MAEASELVEKGLPCPECGSSDAVALYDDGHSYCFSHGGIVKGSAENTSHKSPKEHKPFQEELAKLLSGATTSALQKWGIQQATCRFADYYVKQTGEGLGQHIAVYKNKAGVPVFAKVRKVSTTDTKLGFFAVGDDEQVSLWGIETLGKGGKMVVVTEGEKDRLAGLQLWACKFPVVGLPFGAESSGEAFARALPELCRYDQVVLALDMDGPGRKGAEELAGMLPAGKALIVDFPSKDLHQTVQDHGSEAAIKCIHAAKPFSPDGILDADELDAELLEPTTWGAKLPYEFLYRWTYGLEGGDVWVIGAGTGIGKSDLAAEIVAKHITPVEDGGSYERAAVFNYESGPKQTHKLILGKLWSRRFNIPDPEDGSENVYWSRADLIGARDYRRDKCAKLFINDHKGAISWAAVKERLRYLKHAYGITLAVVDPVAALVAGVDDERKALDAIFAEGKALAEELGITLIFVSHLARPKEGKSHEEGGRVTLANFRGSGAIVMWASFVVVLERNQQGDEEERKLTIVRMLKDRKTGDSTGRTACLVYNVLNGRLEEIVNPLDRLQQDEEEPAPPPPSS